MPIDEHEISTLTGRFDERYVNKEEYANDKAEFNRKFANDDKKLTVIEYRLSITNWLLVAITGGIIALLIKVFLGG